MFKQRIKGKELDELRKRQNLIQQQMLIINALELQKRVWLTDVIKKMGFSDDKIFDVNFKTGEIKEMVNPEVKKEIKK